MVYLPQLLILWVACLPLAAGMTTSAAVGPITVIGGVVWLGGFVFEVVGDWQLTRFRADAADRGADGPRAVAVHPAPELLRGRVHVVGAVRPELRIADPAGDGGVAVADDVRALRRGTGQRMTDRRMAGARPGFAAYAARTSGFIPLPPRRPRAGG